MGATEPESFGITSSGFYSKRDSRLTEFIPTTTINDYGIEEL
jgi:hypothetical protein